MALQLWILLACSVALSVVLLPKAAASLRALSVASGMAIIAIPLLTLLGVVGQLHAGAQLLAASCLLVALGWAAYRRRSRLQQSQNEVGHSTSSSLFLGSAVGVLAVAAWTVAHGHLCEPFYLAWDDYSYHAPMPAHWLQAGELYLAPPKFQGYYPGNAELFTLWFVLPTESDSFAVMAGLFWIGLAAVVAASACRSLGVSRPLALLAGATVLASPPFDHQAHTYAATDLAAGVLMVAALGFLVSSRSTLAAYPRAFYAGALLGLAVGTKITYGPLAVLGLLYLILLLKRNGVQNWLRAASIYVAAASCCGGYWYVRNVVLTGNPFFPADIAFWDGPFDAAARQQTSLLAALRVLNSENFWRALAELADWPHHLLLSILAAYVVAIVSGMWRLRQDVRRFPKELFVALMGLTIILIVFTGPFSGTDNTPLGAIHVRHRFFLGGGLAGVVLLFLLLHRALWARAGLPRLAGFALAALFAISAYEQKYVLEKGSLSVLLALAFGLGSRFLSSKRAHWSRWTAGYRRTMAAAGMVVTVLAAAALQEGIWAKEEMDQQRRAKAISGFNLLEPLPKGTRVAVIGGFLHGRQYRVFGARFTRQLVWVDTDGTALEPLHQHWRRTRPTWWHRPDPRPTSDFVSNLKSQQIDAVLLLKRAKKRWGRQYRYLRASPEARKLAETKAAVLFELVDEVD